MTERCIICYGVNTLRTSTHCNSANIDEGDTLKNKETPLNRFLQLLERYLDGVGGTSIESRSSTSLSKVLLEQLVNSGIGSCEGCSEDLDSFMELYHQMKSIQLSLNWRLKRITDIMIDAEAELFRREEFRKFDKILGRRHADGRSSDEVMKGILEYRKQLISKSTRMLQNDFPKLIVHKCQTEGSTPQIKIEGHSYDSDMETEVQSSSVFCQDEFNVVDADFTGGVGVTNPPDRSDVGLPTTTRCIPSDDSPSDSGSGNISKLSRSDNFERETPRETSTECDEINASGTVRMTSSDNCSGTDSDSDYWNAEDGGVAGSPESVNFKQDNKASASLRRAPRMCIKSTAKFMKVANKRKIGVSKNRKRCPRPTNKVNNSVTTGIGNRHWRFPVEVRKSAPYQGKIKATMALQNFNCKIVNCPKPSYKLCTQSDLENHQKYHGHFTCFFCAETYDYAADLAWHEFMEHSKSDTKSRNGVTLNCPRPNCSMKFTNKRLKEVLTHHILSFHLELIPETLSYQCPVCKLELKSKMGLDDALMGNIMNHYDFNHNTDNLEVGAPIYKCDQFECSAYFNSLLQLDIHKCGIHGLRKLRHGCPDCNKMFERRRYLRAHRRIHHLKEEDLGHHCQFDGCSSRFETEGELKCHVIFGHQGKRVIPVSCSICARVCKGKASLKSHMRSHEPKDKSKGRSAPDKTMYVCDVCGREFRHNAFLKQHQLSTHFRDSWTFQCSLCPKKCMTQQRLDVHMRMHTQEKPFVCDICGLKYAHKHNLKIHVNSSHKNTNKEKS